jgi:hypothetical protein
MMLVEIELERYGTPGLTESQVSALREFSLTEIETEADTNGQTRLHWNAKPIISVDALRLFPGAKVLRTIDNASVKSIGQRNTTIVNEKCTVAVAGLGLLTVNEVSAEVDLCTESLQRRLNEGWRILAVCVQPDQRRPDYVLGRTV